MTGGSAPADEAAPPAEAKPEPPPAPAPPQKTRAEVFAELRAKEAAKLERMRRERDAEQQRAEFDRMQRSLAEERKQIEPLLRIIKSKDLMALNEFVQEHFPPDDVAAAVGSWASDESREKWRARNAQKEVLSATEERFARLEKMIEEAVIAPQRHAQIANQQQAVYDMFANVVKQHASNAPYTFALLERDPKALFALADTTATMLPKGWTFYDVINQIERTYRVEPSPPKTAAPTSTGHSAPPNAAAKATTVTNGHAADRTVLSDDDSPKEGESVDEIARRLKRQWQGASLTSRRGE